MTQRRK